MRPVASLLLLGAGGFALCAPGCLGPIYQPNGPWGPPGYSNYSYPGFGAPGYGYPANGVGSFQTLTPGPQYAPQGTGTSGTPATNSDPTPTYAPGSNAPPYGGTNVPVPTPQDPNPSPYYPGTSYSPGTSENFLPPTTGTSALPARRPQPLADTVGSTAGGGDLNGPRLVTTGLERPAEAPPAADDGDAASRDPSLTGVVHYDPQARTWYIACDAAPAGEGRKGERFTLSASPLLQTLREGERVRLEGSLDAAQRDHAGKPLFRPERIIRGEV